MMQLRHFFSHKTFIFFTSPLVLPPPNAHGPPSHAPTRYPLTATENADTLSPDDVDVSSLRTRTSHRG